MATGAALKDLNLTVCELLVKAGKLPDEQSSENGGSLRLQALTGDGSSRHFFRVFHGSRALSVAVQPGSRGERDIAEFKSARHLATHLRRLNIPVPEVLAVDEKRSLILFEDLGDARLHDIMRGDRQKGLKFYPEAVSLLAHMQIKAAAGFKPHWCFDTCHYDREVMLEKESGYFYRAFWKDTLFGEEIEELDEEFSLLAEQTATYFEPFFLHRDFQSRNIMITDGALRIIDFQAGRLGPPAYDLASLLIDPYVALSDAQQKELFDIYRNEIRRYYSQVDVQALAESYPLLAVQRNLQIIGAFSFLSGKKRKHFFQPYILPSLVMLQNRLADKRFDNYTYLRRIAADSILRYRRLIRR